MFYVIIRNQEDPAFVSGFMTEEDGETPCSFVSEWLAEAATVGHLFESVMEVVEL